MWFSRKVKTALTLSLAACVLSLSSACYGPYVRSVKHPEDIRIYHDRLPLHGSKYRSLGVIHARKQRMGFAFLFWGWDWLSASKHGYGASSEAVAAEMQGLLNRELARKAREVGATAVIEVRYSAFEIGWCAPAWGPFTIHSFSASGEAVKQ